MLCGDCPQMNRDSMPPGWQPRSVCCLDEPALKTAEALKHQRYEQQMDERQFGQKVPPMNRAARRKQAAKDRRR